MIFRYGIAFLFPEIHNWLEKMGLKSRAHKIARSYTSSQKEIGPIYPLNGGRFFRQIA